MLGWHCLFMQRLDSSEEGKDMYFQQSSFHSCLFNIVTQGNEDLPINYFVRLDDLCYFFDEFMVDMIFRCTHHRKQ